MRLLVRAAAAALALALAGAARADGYVESPYRLTRLISLTWEPGVPRDSLRGYVDDATGRGLSFDARVGVARHLSVGFSTSWHWFAQNSGSRTVEYPGAAVTAAVYDRVQLFTFRATFHWYLLDGPVQPFVGVGAGGVWYGAFQAVADVTSKWSGFSWAGDPQVGVLWTVGPGLAVLATARYQFTLARFEDVKDAQFLAVGLGLAVY